MVEMVNNYELEEHLPYCCVETLCSSSLKNETECMHDIALQWIHKGNVGENLLRRYRRIGLVSHLLKGDSFCVNN
jgi:hypothetical protein